LSNTAGHTRRSGSVYQSATVNYQVKAINFQPAIVF